MKVYLINPPAAGGVKIVREGRCMQRQGAWTAVWAPISLALLGSFFEKEGCEVKLSDCIVEEIGFDELEKKVAEFKPDLAIINAVTPSIDSDLSTCSVIKKASKKTVTAAIGIHPTALPEECLTKAPDLDLIVRGEPEPTLLAVARAMKAQKEAFTPAGIAGLSYRETAGIKHEAECNFIADLDQLPFPAWHLVDRSRYVLPFTDKPFLLIATSRGCPYPCRFCADAAYYGKKLRLRSPAKIVDELAWVKDTYGIDEFLFWSESFTINKTFCLAVANEIINRKLKISWVCNSRVDHVSLEMLQLFKKAGCWMIGYGVESGSQEILDSMKKGVTVEQIRQAVTDSHKAGLEVTGHCVLGYPGETVETMKKTIRLTTELPFDFVQFYCSVPFPGSELHAQAVEMGWLTTRDWAQYEQNFSVMNTPQLSAAQVMEWRRKAYRAFYLRPRAVWNVLKGIRSFKEVFILLKMAKDFLTWV